MIAAAASPAAGQRRDESDHRDPADDYCSNAAAIVTRRESDDA
jgi:hypothetical protein